MWLFFPLLRDRKSDAELGHAHFGMLLPHQPTDLCKAKNFVLIKISAKVVAFPAQHVLSRVKATSVWFRSDFTKQTIIILIIIN